MAPILTGWAFGQCGSCAVFSDDERDTDQSFANYRQSFYQAFACRNKLAQVRKLESRGWDVETPNINPELCQLGTIVMSRAIENIYMSKRNVAQPVRELINLRVNCVQLALRSLEIETRALDKELHMYRISDYANSDDRYAELDSERYSLLAEIKILNDELRDINTRIDKRLNTLSKRFSEIESVFLRMSLDLNLNLIGAQSEEDELLITRFRAVLVESFQNWLESLEKEMNGQVGGRRFCTFMRRG